MLPNDFLNLLCVHLIILATLPKGLGNIDDVFTEWWQFFVAIIIVNSSTMFCMIWARSIMKNQFVLLHILFFIFFVLSKGVCGWVWFFFQGGDWCGKIQIIKVKFWKFVFCLLFVPHHLSSFSFCSFSFFLFIFSSHKKIYHT